MNRGGRRPERQFHEWPLVLFSSLGMAGAGVGSAHLLQLGLGGGAMALSAREGVLLVALLLLGLILSVSHVGRPFRGPLALKGAGRSPLSNEILALGATLGLGAVSLWAGGLLGGPGIPQDGLFSGAVGLMASLASVVFLLALGVLYDLPGRPTWRGTVVLHPLVLGTGWGLLAARGAVAGPPSTGLSLPLGLLLLLDGLLVFHRIRTHSAAMRWGEAAFPRFQPLGPWIQGSRLILTLGLAPALLLAGWWWAAMISFSLALLLDRVAFYALAVIETTESEVARVEGFL